MQIKEVLDHPWLQKFNKNKIADKRRNSKDVSSFKMYAAVSEDIHITDETKMEVHK